MSNSLIEYMKIHLTSLYQDMNQMGDIETFDWHYLKGQMDAIEHVLEMYDNV
jgi:hypothetical protein